VGVEFVPGVSIEAVLVGLGRLGFASDALRARLKLPLDLTRPGVMVPATQWKAIWDEAARALPQPELATELAFAIPFGSFGTIDYLACSADTVVGGLHALGDHFSAVSGSIRLELDGDELRAVRTRGDGDPLGRAEEFTLAVTFDRCRRGGGAAVRAVAVGLPRAAPGAATRHAALFGAPVSFARRCASITFDAGALAAPMATSDPSLHRTLAQLAAQLGLGSDRAPLELAVRGRLRDLLPQGGVDASRVARSLGLSERTLQRRLAELGRSYHDIVDDFRSAEAERLLLAGTLRLAEIAFALGFADQSAWNKAFRRWKGQSPVEWMQARRGELDDVKR
jgi:AraC-like DNA-binding protein